MLNRYACFLCQWDREVLFSYWAKWCGDRCKGCTSIQKDRVWRNKHPPGEHNMAITRSISIEKYIKTLFIMLWWLFIQKKNTSCYLKGFDVNVAGVCVDSFILVSQTLSLGGMETGKTDVEQCQQFCLKIDICVAVDYNK